MQTRTLRRGTSRKCGEKCAYNDGTRHGCSVFNGVRHKLDCAVYAKSVKKTESSATDCTGPTSRPLPPLRWKSVTVAESWFPHNNQRSSGERVKWRGVRPPLGKRCTS